MPFADPKEAGRKGGQNKKGARYKTAKTLLREREAWAKVTDAETELLNYWREVLMTGTKSAKLQAARELSKYVFPTKKDVTATVNSHDDFISKFGGDIVISRKTNPVKQENEPKEPQITQIEDLGGLLTELLGDEIDSEQPN